MDSSDPRSPYLKRLTALENERSSFRAHWMDIQEYLLPRRGRFLLTDRNRGNKRNDKIIDATGTMALRTLASGMMAGITSPARPWFRLTTQDPALSDNDEVKIWLTKVERLLRDIFAKSNLYNALPVVYEEMGAFGTGCMLVAEDYDNIIRAYPMTVGEYCLANNDKLEVDTFYREYSLTVSQVVKEFGLDSCTTKTRDLFERGNLDTWVDIIHVIEPNTRKDIKPGFERFPFRSVKFERGGEMGKILSERGYHEFPVMAPRWHLLSTDVYGRSPGMDVLGDIKQLQFEQKRKAQGIDKMVNPPLTGPGSLRNQPISVLPGGVTFQDAMQGQQGLRPVYEVNPRLAELQQDIQETQERIRQGFFADLFQMMTYSDRRQITAREVDERHEEKLLMLGPVLERLHNELLDPLIDRTLAIASRQEVNGQPIVPVPPDFLQGQELKVEYISMLAQAQQAIGIGAIERTVGFVGQLAQADPSAMDKVDIDKVIDDYAEMQGAPPEIIVPTTVANKKRKAREEAIAQQQQAEQAMAMAQQGVGMMKDASQIQSTQDSAVADFLGGLGPLQ